LLLPFAISSIYTNRIPQQTGYAYAKGSDEYMGLYNLQTSTLAETAQSFFVVGSC